MSKKRVKCNRCKKEFLLRAVDIEEAVGTINGKELTLMFFTCPKCNEIYRICLKDEQYKFLQNDLEVTKERYRKSKSVGTSRLLSELSDMIQIKSKRLKDYIELMDKKYPGTFTFTSKNKKGIIYRGNDTEIMFRGEKLR